MDSDATSRFSISYRTLALAGILTTLAATTALILVSAVKGVDALTTVALALAILAFAVQVLFYVAQTAASSEQTQQMMLLNSETKSLLENVKVHVGGMEDLLASHFEYLLKKAFDGRSSTEEADASGDDPDPSPPDSGPPFVPAPLAGSRLFDPALRPENPVEAQLVRPRLPYSPLVGPFIPDAEDLEALSLLSAFPGEPEGRELFETLKQLTPLRIAVLANYARNEREARMRGVRGYLANGSDAYRSEQLKGLGLLESVPEHPLVKRPKPNITRLSLSDRGIRVASLLVAKGRVPQWLMELESS